MRIGKPLFISSIINYCLIAVFNQQKHFVVWYKTTKTVLIHKNEFHMNHFSFMEDIVTVIQDVKESMLTAVGSCLSVTWHNQKLFQEFYEDVWFDSVFIYCCHRIPVSCSWLRTLPKFWDWKFVKLTKGVRCVFLRNLSHAIRNIYWHMFQLLELVLHVTVGHNTFESGLSDSLSF